jgi:hypothetical protein
MYFSAVKFFQFFFGQKIWIRVGIQPEMLDLDPYQMNTDSKPCFLASKLKKVLTAAWKPDPDPGIFGETEFRPRPKCKEMDLNATDSL